jgi:hypothetical protein
MDNERSLAKEITEGFEALKSMRNNEPVAWMQVHYEDNKPTKFSKVKTWEDDIPLYTHPVKELTDAEIQELAEYHGIDSLYESGRLDFARAILRKAQEK